ncbi:hypothetical protein BV898_08941 [Hypsibius exemplaris]|uniref:Uncharacterized protein n=1 Tax=Hypsibius exemplaris TaxID=2072580 RepID=A0A1W0WNZ6_HYPEX|nr:hypothetical protein BV898_08941 [Hypsibius exemplaris]
MTSYWVILWTGLMASCTWGLLPPDYTAMSAREKQHILWKQIDDSAYTELPQEGFSMANFSHLFDPQYDTVSYLRKSDELSKTRFKLVHPFGSVAMVRLKITNRDAPFTGIFKSGGIGLLRISPATMDFTAISVGLGLKIFIDKQDSQNLLLLFTRAGQGANRNFFAHTMSNVIPPMPVHPLDATFEQAILRLPGDPKDNPENGLNVPLMEPASVTSDGMTVKAVTAPYQVTFVPNAKLGWPSNDMTDYRTHLAAIRKGTVLYTVMARLGKDDADVVLGEVVTTGKFVASMYGDGTLFFNHARMPWKQPTEM